MELSKLLLSSCAKAGWVALAMPRDIGLRSTNVHLLIICGTTNVLQGETCHLCSGQRVRQHHAIKYLRYDFNLTASDCADTANFNTQLYIHAPGGKRRKTAAPIDPQASCFCNKFYRKSVPEIGCTRCNRFCHVSRAFPGASTKQVHAAMRSLKCPACAAGSQ